MKKYYLIKEVYINVASKQSEDGNEVVFVAKLTDEELEEDYNPAGFYQGGEYYESEGDLQASEDSCTASAYRYEVVELTKKEYKIAKAVIKAYEVLCDIIV